MAEEQEKLHWQVQVAAIAVVVAIAFVLELPSLLHSPPDGGTAADSGVAKEQVQQPENVKGQVQQTQNASPSASTAPTPGTGPLEQSILSWAAPLLNPGDTTTGFENISPNIRAMRLDNLVNYQIGRLETGLIALKQLESAAEPVQKRVELLARMGTFAEGVRAGPSASLWESIRSAPQLDYRRVDEDRRTFQDAIGRLKAVQATGYVKLDDQRVDARKEVDAASQTEHWVRDQTADLHARQRDLDRVEFTVWTHAAVLPAVVSLRPDPQASLRQVMPNVNVGEHLEMIQTTRKRLDEIRGKTMQFLRSFPKVGLQVSQFLAEPEYRDDPVGSQWARVSEVSGAFLKEFHTHETALDASERAILDDSHYTPSIVLAPVVQANEWTKQAVIQLQERQYAVNAVVTSISTAPVYKANDLMAYMDKRADGRPSTGDKAVVTDVEARRLVFSRHTYAFNFDKPASRYTWAQDDILEPYVSYDYWWRWATDAEWYRGSDVRLDPAKFPKDAPATRKLWREFCSVVDAEARLNAKCVKVVLKNPSAELMPSTFDGPKTPASAVRDYWGLFFLPDEIAKAVGYRRPPTPDVETVRLVESTPDDAELPAKLSIPWKPAPYALPRTWQLPDTSRQTP